MESASFSFRLASLQIALSDITGDFDGDSVAGDDGLEPGELVASFYKLGRSLGGRGGVDGDEIGGGGEGEGTSAGRREVVERRDCKGIPLER